MAEAAEQAHDSSAIETDNNNAVEDKIEKPKWLHSFVWKYFGFKQSLNVTEKSFRNLKTSCTLCRFESNYTRGSTTNMMFHLSRKHHEVCIQKEQQAKFLLLCSLMDPRFKSLPFAIDDRPEILDDAARYAIKISEATTASESGVDTASAS